MDKVEDFLFNIPEENFETLRLVIEKLSKKNEKYGLPAIFIMPIGFKDVKNKLNQVHRTWEVMISGEVPKFEGWEFIAKVDFARSSGNIVYISPTKTIPDEYYSIESKCDHCGYKRRRNTGYIVFKDGEYKIVGSSCINKFFNTLTPEKIGKYYETIRKIKNTCNRYASNIDTRNFNYKILVKDFIIATLQTIEKHGWYGSTKAKENNEYYKSTANLAESIYNAGVFDQKYEKESDNIISYFKSLSDNEVSGNNFLSNLRIIAKDDLAKQQDINLIAGMVRYYQNKFNKIEKLDYTKSQHVGIVGEKIQIELKVYKKHKPVDGNSIIVKFVDIAGNLYTWFNHGTQDLNLNTTYNISAKVIAHNTFNSVKETILTRVKAKKLS